MWRGLEMGESRALASHSIRFVLNHINSIFTVNAPILYLFCNEICKKKIMLLNLIIKKNYGNPMDTSSVCVVMHTCVTRSLFDNTHSSNEIGHY